jgi:hypothetical protein
LFCPTSQTSLPVLKSPLSPLFFSTYFFHWSCWRGSFVSLLDLASRHRQMSTDLQRHKAPVAVQSRPSNPTARRRAPPFTRGTLSSLSLPRVSRRSAACPSQFGITELIIDSGRTDWIANSGGSYRGLSWSQTWAELFAEMTRTDRERVGKMSAKESQPTGKMSRVDCRHWRRGKCGCHVIRLFCSTPSLST